MEGVGPPLVTPFGQDGSVDHDRLAALVGWVEQRGVDFLVPCGSNSEAALMSTQERAAVVETVVDAATVPVIAGTGHPGRQETVRQTELAHEAGADAALVVTPFYYTHSQATIGTYYREVADAVSLPVYLYHVPAYTGTALAPDTVEDLAEHPNIVGMKDSTGDVERFQREATRTDGTAFDLLVGSGSVFAHALAAGATGGILALANVAPEGTRAIYDRFRDDDWVAAFDRNRALVELNWATTAGYGVPGLKAAMRLRGAPAGAVRSPHREVEADVQDRLETLVDAAV